MEYPRIGVVTPSYNQGAFIRETIDSVLGQDYPSIEYRVIDGGSTDDTLDVLKSYGSAVDWISEPDHGQASAINKGLKGVSADIVAFINSDDVYLPGTFSSVAAYFAAHPDASWLTGDHFVIDSRGKRIRSYVSAYKKILRKRPTFGRLAMANYIVQPSTFWRKKLLDEIGFFDESLRYCFDYDFWVRAMLRHPLHVTSRPFSLFRVHGASIGGSEFTRQFAEEHAVLRRYTSSKLLLARHLLHARLIVFAYRLIKR
jgi:glycosyltransferase involved in cell wall biosynthesis